MKVSKKTLLLIAGLVWGIAGGNILRIGVAAYADYGTVWNILISLAIYLAFQLLIFSEWSASTRRVSWDMRKNDSFS